MHSHLGLGAEPCLCSVPVRVSDVVFGGNGRAALVQQLSSSSSPFRHLLCAGFETCFGWDPEQVLKQRTSQIQMLHQLVFKIYLFALIGNLEPTRAPQQRDGEAPQRGVGRPGVRTTFPPHFHHISYYYTVVSHTNSVIYRKWCKN